MILYLLSGGQKRLEAVQRAAVERRRSRNEKKTGEVRYHML